MKKRFLSILTALCLTLTLLPTAALAAETRTVSSSEELSAAIESANEGDTIQLQTSFSVTGGVTIPAGKTLTLDLNGNTLTAQVVVLGDLTIEDSTMTEGPLISEDGKYTVTYANSGKITSAYTTVDAQRGGTVTLESGMVESTGNIALFATGNSMPGGNAINSTVNINGGYVFAREFGASPQGNGATININGGVIEAQDNAVIGGNGTNTTTNNLGGYTINMTGGTLIGRIETGGYVSCGIYHPNDGTVNVSGGTIVSTNGAGIVARAGRTNITGGTIIALGDSATKGKVGDSRVVVTTSGVVLDLAAGYPGAEIENGKATNAQVNISGDPDISGNASAVSVLATSTVTEDDNVMITGGTFKKGTEADKDVGTYFPDGTSLEVNSDGKVIVKADAVAEVNNVGYASLQAAIDAAGKGDTVTLLQDEEQDVTIAAGQEITLDLGTYTLKNASGHTITNNGTLTIIGSGTVDNVTHAKGALVNYGTAVLEGGTFTRSAEASKSPTDNGGNSWYVIDNHGTMTIDGATVTSTGKYSSLIRNIKENEDEAGVLNVKSGYLSNGFITLKNDTAGTLNVTGGTIKSGNQAVQNWSQADLSGGTFKGNVITWSYEEGTTSKTTISGDANITGNVIAVNYDGGSNPAKVEINGGTVIGEISKGTYNEGIVPAEPDAKSSEIQVSGGVFTEDPTPYLTSGKELIRNADGTYSVRNETPSSSSSSDPSYSPILDVSDGGSIKVNPRTPEEDDEVTITVDPDSGYEVDEVTVTDRNGREVKVTAERDGTYTFTQPRGRVTISVTFVREGGSTFFSDVPESFWAYDEIAWAYDNGYVNGTSASAFSPNASISRQQVWMILARLSGADPANMSAAREWAVTNGVSDGTTPGGAVTRQQLVALLYRYATLMGYANDQRADLSAYPDAGTVAGYAVEPMQWSVANSIVGGTSNGTLDPTGTATRAQFAVILYRFWDQVG